MKKRIVMVLLALALVTGGAFAQDFKLSAGVGGLFGMSFETNEISDDVMYYSNTFTGFGGYAFFDATYAQVQVGYLNSTRSIDAKVGGAKQNMGDNYVYNFINLGVYGKYPFALTDKISLFPQIGIEYNLLSTVTVGGKEYTVTNKSDWENLWLKAGAGLDIGLTEQLYLRIEALYGIKFDNESDKKGKDNMEDMAKLYDKKFTRGLENGFTAKLAVGWKF